MDDRADLGGVYRGDAALQTLLREAGSPYDAAGVRALVAGLLAAPPSLDGRTWLELVAPRMTPVLATQLSALRAEVARQAPSADPQPGATAARVAQLGPSSRGAACMASSCRARTSTR